MLVQLDDYSARMRRMNADWGRNRDHQSFNRDVIINSPTTPSNEARRYEISNFPHILLNSWIAVLEQTRDKQGQVTREVTAYHDGVINEKNA